MATQRNRRPLSCNATQIITQAELAHLDQLKPAHDEYEEMRQQIRERALQGVPVEQGRFEVKVALREQRNLTHQVLRAMLGAAAEILIDNIPPTIKHFMSICEAAHGTCQHVAPQRVIDPPTELDEDQPDECPRQVLEELVAILSQQLEATRVVRRPRGIPVRARRREPGLLGQPSRRSPPDFS